MTNKEFSSYIDSFNKKPGEYTIDEIINICGVHKHELCNNDKNWQALTETLGLKKTGEQLRSWFRNNDMYVKREPSKSVLEKADNLDEQEQSFADAKRKLYIERQKSQAILNQYRKNLRDEARIEEFKDLIKDTINNLPKLEFNRKIFVATDKKLNKEAVLGFSDLHLGQEFNNYYNSYSLEIAKKRVEKLINQVIKYCTANNVLCLHFLNLGDLISGTIHTTLRLEQSIDITQQIIYASELVAQALVSLCENIPFVTYSSVVDNHSRVMPNKNESIEKENLNKIIDWYLKGRLKNIQNLTFCENTIDEGIGDIKLKNGKLLVFSHGHNDKKNGCFQDMCGLLKQFPDYIFLAHYHSSAEHTYQAAKVFVNGSIIGTDTYAFNRRLFAEPEQKLLIFDNSNDIINININLSEENKECHINM